MGEEYAEGQPVTAIGDLANKASFSFSRKDGKEVLRITPDGVVIVQGDVWEAAQMFWVAVQELAPKGWKIVKEPQGQGKGHGAKKGQGGERGMKMERNEFDNALRALALRYAPEQIAKCGDVVTAQWGSWKNPHKVKITRVDVVVSSIDFTIRQREESGLTGWLTVQHRYIGKRLKANGEPTGSPGVELVLSGFTTSAGQKFESIPSGFNHVGLVFETEVVK